jgi:two-component system, OmpR family, response regulator MtrA
VAVQRVLVVDDEPTIRQLLEINLLAEGIHVAAVADGFSARRAALNDPPDLIILDVMMPGLDGLELLRELRRDPRTVDIPVVLLTARTSDAEVWAGWAAGADYYLTKPFDIHELLDFIESFGADGAEGEGGETVAAVEAAAVVAALEAAAVVNG